jgi:hypothetical protein
VPIPPSGPVQAPAWCVVQRKLKMLDVAARVDDQYRMAFRWENGHAFEVAVEDYR